MIQHASRVGRYASGTTDLDAHARLFYFFFPRSFSPSGGDVRLSAARPNGLIPPMSPLVGVSPPPPSAFMRRFNSELVKFGDAGNPLARSIPTGV